MSFSYYGELCTEVYDLTKKVGQSLSDNQQIVNRPSLMKQREDKVRKPKCVFIHMDVTQALKD